MAQMTIFNYSYWWYAKEVTDHAGDLGPEAEER